MNKSIEELNLQLKGIKSDDDLIQLLKDIIENNYYLVHHNEFAPLGCQHLSTFNYDIVIDDNKNKFTVNEFLQGSKVRFYKTMHKHFTICKADIIAHDSYGNPHYMKGRYNIIDYRENNLV